MGQSTRGSGRMTKKQEKESSSSAITTIFKFKLLRKVKKGLDNGTDGTWRARSEGTLSKGPSL